MLLYKRSILDSNYLIYLLSFVFSCSNQREIVKKIHIYKFPFEVNPELNI